MAARPTGMSGAELFNGGHSPRHGVLPPEYVEIDRPHLTVVLLVFGTDVGYMNSEWLSTGDVARILDVSRQHVVDLCDRGDLPSTRIGRHRKIRRSDLEPIAGPRLTLEQEKSLWLHRAVLGALMLDPEGVVRTARENLARWKGVHLPDGMSAKYLGRWAQTIDAGVDVVAETLTSTSERAVELRQNSPFAGVLSGEQRVQALRAFRQHWSSVHKNEPP